MEDLKTKGKKALLFKLWRVNPQLITNKYLSDLDVEVYCFFRYMYTVEQLDEVIKAKERILQNELGNKIREYSIKFN